MNARGSLADLRAKAERPVVYPLNRDECLALLDRLAAAEASLVAHREALREIELLLDQADLGHGDYWLGNLDRAKNVARAALAVVGREEDEQDLGGDGTSPVTEEGQP